MRSILLCHYCEANFIKYFTWCVLISAYFANCNSAWCSIICFHITRSRKRDSKPQCTDWPVGTVNTVNTSRATTSLTTLIVAHLYSQLGQKNQAKAEESYRPVEAGLPDVQDQRLVGVDRLVHEHRHRRVV